MTQDIFEQAAYLASLEEPVAQIESQGIRYFYLPALQKLGLDHLYSSVDVNMKVGGRSEDPHLLQAWQDFIDLMPQSHSSYYFMHQTHSDLALAVEKEGLGERVGLGRRLQEPDGLYTSRSDFLLSSSFADCAPLLIFAPEQKIQANIHSGWRGTLQDIGGKTVAKLQQDYQLKPSDLYVYIGPHIGPEDFEVDLDVALLFTKKYPDLPNLVRKKAELTPAKEAGGEAVQKYLVNLNLLLIYNFLRAGLPAGQIHSVNRSTVAHPEDYHSYRRDKDKFGLMMVLSQIRV